jgi:hypothetical protein
MRHRLDELVPGPASYDSKIDTLLDELDRQVPDSYELTTFQKLEMLGDGRLSDDGRLGLPNSLLNMIRGLYPESTSAAEKIERATIELAILRSKEK